MTAHRAAYLLANGPAPDGAFIMHSCDNRICVNPAHLVIGSHRDNMADMKKKGRAGGGSIVGEPWLKLTPETLVDILRRHEKGEAVRALARAYGGAPNAIRHALVRAKREPSAQVERFLA